MIGIHSVDADRPDTVWTRSVESGRPNFKNCTVR